MQIHQNFTGGNICLKERKGNKVFLGNELRDTTHDWFYWAFCVEDAQGQTLTFQFTPNRLGYFGPAVSYDLENWHWLDSAEGDSFTYTFGENEDKVYFAHNMLYHPKRFLRFAAQRGLQVGTLCTGYKGSDIPCVRFGSGKRSVILTARHHACESTGNYVLEGVLSALLDEPIADTTVFCVPFVDYEGVIRGDQGKGRDPRDHNRDYDAQQPCIYPECAAIKTYALENGCHYGFDFHSPWHKGNENDNVFIVQNSIPKLPKLNRFAQLLEDSMTEKAMRYWAKNDYPPQYDWNFDGPQFGNFMTKLPENQVAFTLETAYFGTEANKVSQENLLELGRCFVSALKAYIATEE